MHNTFKVAALLCLLALMHAPTATPWQTSQPARGDGIFTPTITPVAAIDKTGRPITVEVRDSEPRLAQSMLAGNPTGDSYIINFPQGDAGGPCIYSGTGRYIINIGGTLTFQVLANCGNLRRGYSYMVCTLNTSLRCNEPPWWYFRERTYVISNEGITVNGSTLYAWQDAAEAPQQLKIIAGKIQAMSDRFRSPNDPHVVHGRYISCRDYHPDSKSYGIHEFPTTCMIKSLCNGMPNVDSLCDGEPIDLNSSAGSYVKQQSKAADFSNWVCWMRTQ